MKDKDIIIKELETKVQELQEELEMANAVKKTEVALKEGDLYVALDVLTQNRRIIVKDDRLLELLSLTNNSKRILKG